MDSSAYVAPPIAPTRRRRRLHLLLTGIALLILAAAVTVALRPALVLPYFAALRRRAVAANAPPPAPPAPVAVPVVAVRAIVGTVPIQLPAIGTVQAYNTVNLQSRVDGAITAILFREGQSVSKGDVLIEIDPRPYQAQLDQAMATRDKDAATLAQAQLDAQRYDRLAQDNFASRQQAEQQRALVRQYAAQLRFDVAQIEYAATQLGYTRITAPIGGRIGIRNVDVGNVVRASDGNSLAVITQLQPISVVLTVAAQTLGRTALTIGQADVPVAALSQAGTVLDRGTVRVVNNSVDPNTGTIKLKAEFANRKLRLWPGDFVRALLTVAERENAVTVPVAAVRHGPHGDFVWRVTASGLAHVQPILAEQTFDGRTLIERGVAPGQLLVIDGYYQLREGMPVSVQEPNRRHQSPPAH